MADDYSDYKQVPRLEGKDLLKHIEANKLFMSAAQLAASAGYIRQSHGYTAGDLTSFQRALTNALGIRTGRRRLAGVLSVNKAGSLTLNGGYLHMIDATAGDEVNVRPTKDGLLISKVKQAVEGE